MKNELKLCLAVFLFVSLSFFISCPVCYAGGIFSDRDFGSIPGPTLLAPSSEKIGLKSQSFVEFRWERTDQGTTDHYEFRLYKGYQTVEDTLLMKKQISTDEYPFKLDASTFEVGQVYTWCLIQIYNGGKKSDKSYDTFKIIKK